MWAWVQETYTVAAKSWGTADGPGTRAYSIHAAIRKSAAIFLRTSLSFPIISFAVIEQLALLLLLVSANMLVIQSFQRNSSFPHGCVLFILDSSFFFSFSLSELWNDEVLTSSIFYSKEQDSIKLANQSGLIPFIRPWVFCFSSQ